MFNKLVLMVVGFLFSFSVLAEEKVRMSCVTEFPTTTYQIIEQENQFDLVVFHHNGTKYLPLFTGTITPSDLPMLKERAETMEKMGVYNRIAFHKEECTNKGVHWRCSTKRKTKVGELEAERIIFWMAPKEVKYDSEYEWTTTETSLALKVNGEELAMRYTFFGKDCVELN